MERKIKITLSISSVWIQKTQNDQGKIRDFGLGNPCVCCGRIFLPEEIPEFESDAAICPMNQKSER